MYKYKIHIHNANMNIVTKYKYRLHAQHPNMNIGAEYTYKYIFNTQILIQYKT